MEPSHEIVSAAKNLVSLMTKSDYATSQVDQLQQRLDFIQTRSSRAKNSTNQAILSNCQLQDSVLRNTKQMFLSYRKSLSNEIQETTRFLMTTHLGHALPETDAAFEDDEAVQENPEFMMMSRFC